MRDFYDAFHRRWLGVSEPAFLDWIDRTWDPARAIVTPRAACHLADDKGACSLAYEDDVPGVDPRTIGGTSLWLPQGASPPAGWKILHPILVYEHDLRDLGPDAPDAPAAPDEEGGEIVLKTFGELGWIDWIFVPEALRGRGLGARLLRRALRGFAREGRARAGLFVVGDNAPAIRLYERHRMRHARTWIAFAAQNYAGT